MLLQLKVQHPLFNSPILHGPRAAAQWKAGFIQPPAFKVTVTWATQCVEIFYVETCR